MVTLGSLLPVPVHSAAWRETNLSNISCLTNETERLETDFKSEVIIPLFTFGSIYSTNASEAEKCLKQIIEIKLTRVKNPTGRRQTSWLFTSVVEDLNSGLPRTNPAGGQCGTWTWGLRIASPALKPLGHAAPAVTAWPPRLHRKWKTLNFTVLPA